MANQLEEHAANNAIGLPTPRHSGTMNSSLLAPPMWDTSRDDRLRSRG
jgi:hypothetical protein